MGRQTTSMHLTKLKITDATGNKFATAHTTIHPIIPKPMNHNHAKCLLKQAHDQGKVDSPSAVKMI